MDTALDYKPLGGDRHRHGATVHSHPIRDHMPMAITDMTTSTVTATA